MEENKAELVLLLLGQKWWLRYGNGVGYMILPQQCNVLLAINQPGTDGVRSRFQYRLRLSTQTVDSFHVGASLLGTFNFN